MSEQIILTSQELFKSQAPMFHFELNEMQIVDRALRVGFVTKVEGDNDLYLVNEDYEEMSEDDLEYQRDSYNDYPNYLQEMIALHHFQQMIIKIMSGEKERLMIDKQKINEQKEFVVELSERLADDEDYNSYWQPKFWDLLITINQMEREIKQ